MRRSRLLALWAFGIYLLLYLPMVVMAVNSFNAARYGNRWEGFTWSWYAALWKDEEILAALWTSLWIGAISTVIAAFIGTTAALALRGSPARSFLKNRIEGVLMIPVILPEIVIGISLLLLFVLAHLRLGTTTVILSHVTFGMTYVFLVVRVRLKGLDPSLEEAAQDLGATPTTTFFRVTFPLILPGIVAGALLAFTLSFEDFLITFFTAGVGTTTLPIRIYSMMKFGVTPTISALSTVFLILTIAATFLTQQRPAEKG
jgi:spermidine/putrescine transport system permease protein